MAQASSQILARLSDNVAESMGQRAAGPGPELAPTASRRDVGRRALRQVGTIEIEQVVADPDQPRVEFDDDSIERLAQSMREKGQLMPIHVRWSQEIGKWIIIVGERRWRAAKRAGLSTVDCRFHEGELAPAEILGLQLVENLVREDLKPIEQARAFRNLMELNGWGVRQISRELSVPVANVSRALALLRLPEDLQERVDDGELAARSAYELTKLEDDSTRERIAAQASAGNLTHDQVADAVKRHADRPQRKSKTARLSFGTGSDVKVNVTTKRGATYHHVELALVAALEEVRHRISNNVQLF